VVGGWGKDVLERLKGLMGVMLVLRCLGVKVKNLRKEDLMQNH